MLDLVGLRVDHLVIDRCPEQVKQMREDNHQPRQDEENHRRMRDFVPDPFNAVEELLQKRFWCFDRFRYGHNTPLPLISANPSPRTTIENRVVFASGCIRSKSTAEFILEVSIGLARSGGSAASLGGDERNLASARGHLACARLEPCGERRENNVGTATTI